MSQSLFYWNPFCNNEEPADKIAGEIRRNPYFIGILSAIELKANKPKKPAKSQSLFYWNPFCNFNRYVINNYLNKVAILILLESFLQ